MESRKVLSGLCYLSIFFAGIIFPLVVLFASEDEETKGHAKKSLLSHLVPLIPTALLVFAILTDVSGGQADVPVFTIISVVIFMLTVFVVVIWNIVKGIKIFTAK